MSTSYIDPRRSSSHFLKHNWSWRWLMFICIQLRTLFIFIYFFSRRDSRAWSCGRGRTGRCPGGRVLLWVIAGSRHRRPASACRWSRRSRSRRWWRTWGGGRPGRWPPGCRPCPWWRRPSGSAGWNIAARQRTWTQSADSVNLFLSNAGHVFCIKKNQKWP